LRNTLFLDWLDRSRLSGKLSSSGSFVRSLRYDSRWKICLHIFPVWETPSWPRNRNPKRTLQTSRSHSRSPFRKSPTRGHEDKSLVVLVLCQDLDLGYYALAKTESPARHCEQEGTEATEWEISVASVSSADLIWSLTPRVPPTGVMDDQSQRYIEQLREAEQQAFLNRACKARPFKNRAERGNKEINSVISANSCQAHPHHAARPQFSRLTKH